MTLTNQLSMSYLQIRGLNEKYENEEWTIKKLLYLNMLRKVKKKIEDIKGSISFIEELKEVWQTTE